MFGRRPDGKQVGRNADPITRLMPYIMTERIDAQVASTQFIDSERLSGYIRRKRSEGFRVTHMELVIAAFVRVVSQMPHLNRFVVGKKLYARKELTVSFAILKERSRHRVAETTVKIFFDPADTIYDVSKRVSCAIGQNRTIEDSNSTDRLANTLLSIPGFPLVAVGFLKGLDRVGLLPKAVIDISPFHSSMFFTNMGSINLGQVHHHIYNFGTTSYFFGLGRRTSRLHLAHDGTVSARRCYPIGVVNDERIAPGGMQGLAFALFKSLLRNPEKLEQPPEKIYYDLNLEYHRDKPD